MWALTLEQSQDLHSSNYWPKLEPAFFLLPCHFGGGYHASTTSRLTRDYPSFCIPAIYALLILSALT